MRSTHVHSGAGRAHAFDRRLSWLERLTVAHVAILGVSTTWAFGGNADWVRTPLAACAALGLLITAVALTRPHRSEHTRKTARWLWPLAAFNALVIASAFNPTFRDVVHEGETLFIHRGGRAAWPSAAFPAATLDALWRFDALWMAAFNLALVARQRRALRTLLGVLVANALVLAVFGTVQKLSGASGLYFNAVPSPQKFFFATFVYHNHWGAYVLLMLAAGLGLTWHYARRVHGRDILHSPVLAAGIVLLLLAVTLPLSTSRSTSVLATMLLLGAGLHWLRGQIRKRRSLRESIVPPLAGAVAALVLAIGAVWFVARDPIVLRVQKTREQVADMQARGTIGARAVLYGDTWRMAADKAWFGWGMASYPHVFTLYNSRESVDRLPVYYHDAHSDWLQSLAEHGFIGTALLGLCALVPLRSVGRRQIDGPIARYLLAGCALVVLYAWVEFPFGNLAVVLYWWICFFAALQYARLGARAAGVR